NLNISFEELYDDNVPQGFVISQEPAENTSVQRDHIVKVYISKGKAPATAEPKFNVPNLIGLTREEAIKRIEEAGFAVGYVTEVQSDRGIDTVTWQSPTSVEQMPTGTVINIRVSQGRTIPNLVGMTVDQARDVLSEIGFDVGNISYVDQAGASGTIIIQTPAAETVIDVEKQGKPYIEVSVVYYKAVLEFDTSIFTNETSEIKVIYFDHGNEVVETVFELTPDTPPPASINVLAKQPGTRTYHILVDGVEVDSVDVTFE
ncbi:MAG TPA: PASTA domain-containing protein, partial [Clostridia bacterium]|nr:PASTA domain-containing protein [Clostridia bacterium]